MNNNNELLTISTKKLEKFIKNYVDELLLTNEQKTLYAEKTLKALQKQNEDFSFSDMPIAIYLENEIKRARGRFYFELNDIPSEFEGVKFTNRKKGKLIRSICKEKGYDFISGSKRDFDGRVYNNKTILAKEYFEKQS